MTVDNVIDTCDNLNDLELDFEKWNMLTYDQKKKSDDICISLHGMNNTEYYEKQKALLLTINEATMIIDNSEANAMNDKLLQSKIAMQNNDMVVVIPLIAIDIADLENLYNRYTQLPQQFKNLSNGESLKIWGVSVEDAYAKVKGMLSASTSEEEANDQADTFIESAAINIKNILENNDQRLPLDKKPFDYTDDIPQVVPLMTYNEYCNLFDDKLITVNNYINIDDPKKYYDTIESLQLKLESAKTKEEKELLENSILKAGWFPYKKINGQSLKEARERQAKWFNENMQFNIIDLTEFNFDFIPDEDLLNETEGIEGDVSRLQPIFISLISTKTPIGKVIRAYTHSDYSHAGIAMNSKLDKIYSYAINNDIRQKGGGFTLESIKYYMDIGSTLSILVLALFIDKDVKKKMKEQLKYYEKNQTKTRYDGGDFVNIVYNIKKKNANNSLNMVCSQFVDHILKTAGVDITNKSSNLVSPKMLSEVDPNSTNIYMMYKGTLEDYKPKNIDKQVKYLLNTLDFSKLSAMTSDNMRNRIANTNKMIEAFMSVCTDNEEVNNVLREFRTYIAPSTMIEEFNIEDICDKNHRSLMTSSHSDLDNIAKLLYENRGLKLYMESNKIKNSEKLINVLETDFSMYRNILANTSLSNNDLTGFAAYYQNYINKFNMKYDGKDINMI